MFAALIGEVDGHRLISAELMNAARQTQASGRDAVLRMRTDWGLGFALPGGPLWPSPAYPDSSGTPAAAAPWPSPTPSTGSPSATRRT